MNSDTSNTIINCVALVCITIVMLGFNSCVVKETQLKEATKRLRIEKECVK